MISTFFLKFFFWLILLILVYHYLMFPLLLLILSRFKRIQIELKDYFSEKVSILIAAHNEESVIANKIYSIIQGNFPHQNLEILIGSDASTDKTLEICENISKNFPIKVFAFEARQGKPEIINFLVNQAQHSIILITDADVIFEKQTVSHLIRAFSDSKVGLCESITLDLENFNKKNQKEEKTYLRIEQFIKQKESEIFGQIMGPSGACFALRKELFQPVPTNFLVDDFYISMKVLEQGFFTVINKSSIVYENIQGNIKEQFRRKKRIGTGNYQNLSHFKHLLNPKYGSIAFLFWSHKVFRWLSPFFLLIILLLSSCLIRETYYKIFLYLYLFSIFAAILDAGFRHYRKEILLLRYVSHFFAMNSALFLGFVNYIKGVKTNVWQPTKRNHAK